MKKQLCSDKELFIFKKLILVIALMPALSFAGGDVTMLNEKLEDLNLNETGLVHRHIPSLYTYVCAQLPKLETLSQEDKRRLETKKCDKIRSPFKGICSFYEYKDLLTHSPAPKEIFEYKSADHYWYNNRKIPQCIPLFANFITNKECSQSLVQHTDAPHNEVLIVASAWGLTDDVEKHLNAGADVHTADIEEDMALGLATRNGYRDCVDLLVDRGANIHNQIYLYDIGNGDPKTALSLAAIKNNTDIMELLLRCAEDEADGAVAYEADDALVDAAEEDNLSAVQVLINHGANVNTNDGEPLRRAIDPDVIQLLVNCGAKVKDVLYDAVSDDDHKKVEILIRCGADVNSSHLIEIAGFYSDQEMVDLLRKHGTHVNRLKAIEQFKSEENNYHKTSRKSKDLLNQKNA